MYKDKFVLSIIHGGHPVKETGHKGNKEIAIPFDSEYKVRLKNKNDRSCTARVFIDDKRVSQLGDVIISAGGTIDLERYIDRSLDQGKRFKFVPLDHSDVDDPTSSSNGIIKVEFRKAKHQNGIKINPDFDWYEPIVWPPKYREDNNGPQWVYTDDKTTAGKYPQDATVYYSNSNMVQSDVNCCASLTKSSSFVSPGATVEGSKSNQRFTYSDLEVEDHAIVLKLKIVGIDKGEKMRDTKYKYCTQCGQKVKRVDKYCSECGHRV